MFIDSSVEIFSADEGLKNKNEALNYYDRNLDGYFIYAVFTNEVMMGAQSH